MNDTERAQWIDNFEPLYLWWQSKRRHTWPRMGMQRFIRENREEIDHIIRAERDRPPIR